MGVWLVLFLSESHESRASQLDPYRSHVEKRWSEGFHHLMGIYRDLQAQGFQGSSESVRAQFVNTSPRCRNKQAFPSPHHHAFPARRLAAFLFLRDPDNRTREERESGNNLRQLDPEIDQAYLFAQQCVEMMRTRTGACLDAWLQAGGESSLVELHAFVNSVSKD